jgi:hypothetical protein
MVHLCDGHHSCGIPGLHDSEETFQVEEKEQYRLRGGFCLESRPSCFKRYRLSKWIVLMLQSYGGFQQIPRKTFDSSSTCMDKRPIFGQIEEIHK